MKTPTTDFLTPSQRSGLMRRIRSSNTGPELALASALRALAVAFETNCVDLPGKPDIVMRSDRTAIFIDGEFWHGGQSRKRGLRSLAEQFPDQTKRDRWIRKIQRNCIRDLLRTAELLAKGWRVMRFWAGDVEKSPPTIANLVVQALAGSLAPSAASYLPAMHVAEFFAGIGLARIGLKDSGWTVLFANDNSPHKIAFYKENEPGVTSRLDVRDIHNVAAKDVPTVALATACFPCTDLSLAGAQRGLEPGTESSAYLRFTKILSEMGKRRPAVVLLENVLGMINSREGIDFTICLEQLKDAGYTVDPFVLDAKWFVPQSRPRLFVVAIRDDLKAADHLSGAQIAEATTLRPPRLAQFISSHPNLPWSLRPLPSPERAAVDLKDVLEEIPNCDERWWSSDRAERLYNQMSARHRDVADQMMKSPRAKYGTVFRRMRNGQSTAELRTDNLAGCLRTPKGGSARQILFRASSGKYAVRLLTPRECARLMGADEIRIPEAVSTNTALFAFGDGVCVPVVRWIAENYLAPLASELIHGRLLYSGSSR